MAQVGLIPVATWGLTVAPNEEPEDAFGLTTPPGTLQLTMAAIDPDEDTSKNTRVGEFKKPRATVKMIVLKDSDEDESEDEDGEDLAMADLLDDDDDDEDSPNGEGPSDPKRSPKAMKRSALKKEIKEDENDVLANGVKPKAKGKGKASPLQDADEDDVDDEELDISEGMQEFVLCTLDPENHFQQPLNITIPLQESAAFVVTGTHSIHLTGNIVVSPADDGFGGSETSEDEDEDVDLSPAESDLDMEDGEESDELDDVDDPRVTELGSDEEDEVEAPKLIKKDSVAMAKAGKKRSAPEEDSSMIGGAEDNKPTDKEATEVKIDGTPTVGPDGKPLSKSQIKKMRKKIKDNAGNAVAVEATVNGDDKKIAAEVAKESPSSKTKSVQFAEKLVQGPSATNVNGEGPKDDSDKKGAKNPRVVDGVTIDDKKIGTGPAAKKGDKVSMRYIGKLDSNKKQFDANKKGPPFSFKLGTGQVIKGWDVGVAGMAVGGERRITVPPQMGYGSKKMDEIPANSTLVFDVKLLEVNKK